MRKLLPATVAVAAVLTGCSSHTSTPAASPNSTATQATPITPRSQLVLTVADFPPGTKVQQVSPDQLAKATDDMSTMEQTAKTEPPQCGVQQQDLAKKLAELQAKASYTFGINDSQAATYFAMVANETPNLNAMTSNLLGPCSTVTTQMTAEGITTKTTTHVVLVPSPAGLRANQAIAYQSTSATSTPGGPAKVTQLNTASGFATVRGLTVAIRVQDVGRPVDVATFDRLFAAAVDKVRNAK